MRVGQDGKRQAERLLGVVDSGSPSPSREAWPDLSGAHSDSEDKLVLDCELEEGLTKSIITRTTLAALECIRKESGEYPLIYSRAGWVNEFLSVEELPEGVEWWLAQYYRAKEYPAFTAEYPSPPLLPKGVGTWRIHQTGEKGNGSAVGVGSYYVDTDRFNGDEDALGEWFGRKPLVRTLEEHFAHAKCMVRCEWSSLGLRVAALEARVKLERR